METWVEFTISGNADGSKWALIVDAVSADASADAAAASASAAGVGRSGPDRPGIDIRQRQGGVARLSGIVAGDRRRAGAAGGAHQLDHDDQSRQPVDRQYVLFAVFVALADF